MPVEPMPVSVRGVVFKDARACAEHFGIHIDTVYWHLSQGSTDTLGLGNRAPRRWGDCHRQSITIAGVEFGSMKDASLWLDCKEGYVSNTLKKRGYEEGMKRLERMVRDKLSAIQSRALTQAMEADSAALKRRLRETEAAYKDAVRESSPAAADLYYHR